MDPNETLRQINQFLVDRKHGKEVDEWCEDLKAWITRGGFKPAWDKYPLATSYFKCICGSSLVK